MHIYDRFLYLLWRHWPKKSLTIKGVHAEYLELPWWLLLGWTDTNTFFVGGMCMVHRPTKTSMIFVPSCLTAKELRYVVFHEWYEARVKLLERSREWRMIEIFEHRLNLLDKMYPGLRDAFLEFGENNCDVPHMFALAIELVLANKELDKEEFDLLAKEAVEKRL